MIQPHDEPILSHLTDIKVYLLEDPMVTIIFLRNQRKYLYYNMCHIVINSFRLINKTLK